MQILRHPEVKPKDPVLLEFSISFCLWLKFWVKI